MTTFASEPAFLAPTLTSASALPETELIRRRLMRLAFDVHDGPMQSLTAVGWGLAQIRDDLEQPQSAAGTTAATARLDLLAAELASVEAGLRSLITALERGGSAEVETLDQIAATEIARFTSRCDASVELVVSGNLRPVDSHSQALAIAAVLREALNNIAKHANATQVLVRLLADDAETLLEISDNGDGFNPDTTSTGIGLTSMHERLNLLAGTLEISSAPGGPTQITARFRRWQPPTHRDATALRMIRGDG
jgi:signal transduction histidine kinase